MDKNDWICTLWLQSKLLSYLIKEICLPITYKSGNEMRSNKNKTWVLYFELTPAAIPANFF